MLTIVNNNKHKNIYTLDMIHVKHDIRLRHITEMSSMVIKDFLLCKCPLLSRIAWNLSLR